MSPATGTTPLDGMLGTDVLDAELAALVSLLVEHGLSLVVASPRLGQEVADVAAALDPTRVAVDLDALGGGVRALVRAASLGSGFAGTIEASSLETVYERLRAASGLSDDELSYLGVVLILDGSGRVVAAHHVRPVALDGQGHVQRLGPAVLAARDPASGLLEHFAWGVLPELASRIGWKAGDLEAEIANRGEQLGAHRMAATRGAS